MGLHVEHEWEEMGLQPELPVQGTAALSEETEMLEDAVKGREEEALGADDGLKSCGPHAHIRVCQASSHPFL